MSGETGPRFLFWWSKAPVGYLPEPKSPVKKKRNKQEWQVVARTRGESPSRKKQGPLKPPKAESRSHGRKLRLSYTSRLHMLSQEVEKMKEFER